jgi:hypothetical protein
MFASVLRLPKPYGLVLETGLSGLVAVVSWSRLLSWPLSSLPELYPALLSPPLDLSPRRASLHHWPKPCSSALSSPECFPVDQQKTHWVSPALAGDQVLLLLPEKLDGPIWYSDCPIFLPWGFFCPAGGRRVCKDCLMCSSLHGQNPE